MYDVYVLGASMYDVRKIFGFCVPTPLPPFVRIQLYVLFVCKFEVFFDPPSPPL